MRSMTEENAELYIKAGYFPMDNEIEAICDLQDVFGHQRYWANIRWLYQKDTSENAERLFRLIWNKDDVNRYVTTALNIRNKEEEKSELLAEIAELKARLEKITKEIEDTKEKMYYNE